MLFGVVLARGIGLHAGGDGLVLPLLATQILWTNLVHRRAARSCAASPPRPGGFLEGSGELRKIGLGLCLTSGTKS
jgi:hypothetical protein